MAPLWLLAQLACSASMEPALLLALVCHDSKVAGGSILAEASDTWYLGSERPSSLSSKFRYKTQLPGE